MIEYEILPITAEQLEEHVAIGALMKRRDITPEELEKITGWTVNKIRILVRRGMPKNPDGTFCFDSCNEWWKKKRKRRNARNTSAF